MRHDQLEVGIEREYALYAIANHTTSYLLAVDRLLRHVHGLEDLQAEGWRIAPEYSHCLVEVASPPVLPDDWPALLAGFERIERMLARAADELQTESRFERIELTAEYSVRTDRFITWDGDVVTTYADLLLEGAHDNWLLGSPDSIPPCLVGCSPELLYAGFTSTNVTLHPPAGSVDDAEYYERILRAARQLDTGPPLRHPILREGRIPVAPDPDRSIRDALIRWGDPDAYSCRTRIVEGVTLFEVRCLHSGLDLANLAPLLAVR